MKINVLSQKKCILEKKRKESLRYSFQLFISIIYLNNICYAKVADQPADGEVDRLTIKIKV